MTTLELQKNFIILLQQHSEILRLERKLRKIILNTLHVNGFAHIVINLIFTAGKRKRFKN